MLYRFPRYEPSQPLCVVEIGLRRLRPRMLASSTTTEARKAILDLRTKTDSLSSQLSAAQRTILDQSNRLDQLNQQVATLARAERGHVQSARHAAKTAEGLLHRSRCSGLKKFEPQQQTVDGVQGEVQPGETDAFNAASTAVP